MTGDNAEEDQPEFVDAPVQLVDSYGRAVTYLRVSVTDRCDFRCVYCMSENMTFLPKRDLLTYRELERICGAFIARGVRKIRITGGEPLVRRDIMSLIGALGSHVRQGRLDELTVTTNGSQLRRFARPLIDAGVKRINVSLDTLDEARFTAITRWGRLPQVLDGMAAAREAGLKLKINMVALKGVNDDEIVPIMHWAHGEGMDLTLIETMPLGEVTTGRAEQYLSLAEVRADLECRFALTDLPDRTGGPARYVKVEETGGRLGFITPLSHNFCESCNRVRMTCTGQLYMCLGQDDMVDLRGPLRASADDGLLHAALDRAMIAKPKGHDFMIGRRDEAPAISRHMSVTGG